MPSRKTKKKSLAKRPRRSKKTRVRSAPRTYKHLIPSVKKIADAVNAKATPVSFAFLADFFGINDQKLKQRLKNRLKKMLLRGLITQNRAQEYSVQKITDRIVGKVSAHRDGFGFLLQDDSKEDIFLAPHTMKQLMDGDRISVNLSGVDNKGRPKGELVEILDRVKTTAVGRFFSERGLNYVIENGGSKQRYLVALKDVGGAIDGQIVKVDILSYPTKRRQAHGKVIALLGSMEDSGILTKLAIENFQLRDSWPKKTLNLANAFGEKINSKDGKNRIDLRGTPLVTIDGADARDFDDAVYAEPLENGWRLIVAIADVSHYINIDDALDKEASKRGTSVYFPDFVLPMLPEKLSNGLCSLNPDVDRLCLACEIEVSLAGKAIRSKFYRAVMKSHARLTYKEVDAAVFQQDYDAQKKLARVLPHLQELGKLYNALAESRDQRGALNLEIPEVRIALTENLKAVKNIAPHQRNDAHRLIEECMILANVEAAKFLSQHKIPTLFRAHPQLELERFEELRLFLQGIGFKVSAEVRSQPQALNNILLKMRKQPNFTIMAMSILRSLSKAVYQPRNEGHFGLALDAYCHFTSPIRRYPDLLVHRGIIHILESEKPSKFFYKPSDLEQIGKNCSILEREAESAGRYVESRYKCLFLKDHVNGEFEGVITGVMSFGLFVMLDDFYAEGLIHVTNLGKDYFSIESGGLRLSGENTGKSFSLGDALRVKIKDVDVEEARIDLQLVEFYSRD
ncbi:MAG: ribonuclease R [Pseudomonadota bacterium]|nr:ribonuclease R [Pseudomonadota bacterium]